MNFYVCVHTHIVVDDRIFKYFPYSLFFFLLFKWKFFIFLLLLTIWPWKFFRFPWETCALMVSQIERRRKMFWISFFFRDDGAAPIFSSRTTTFSSATSNDGSSWYLKKYELNEKVENFSFLDCHFPRDYRPTEYFSPHPRWKTKQHYDFLIFVDNVLCVIWKMGETKWKKNFGRKLANRPNKNEWN